MKPTRARPYDEQAVARRFRYERERRGWSAERVADRMREHGADVDKAAVWKIENGQRGVKAADLIAAARVFGVRPEALLDPPELVARADAVRAVEEYLHAVDEVARAITSFVAARDRVNVICDGEPNLEDYVLSCVRAGRGDDPSRFTFEALLAQLGVDNLTGDPSPVALVPLDHPGGDVVALSPREEH